MLVETPISECREWVRQGLDKVLAKFARRSKWPSEWATDEVLKELDEGRAGLFVIPEAGFFVIQVRGEAGHKYINVWISWFQPGKGKPHHVDIVNDLHRIKDVLECSWIQFSSPFRGWDLLGAKPHMTVWRF